LRIAAPTRFQSPTHHIDEVFALHISRFVNIHGVRHQRRDLHVGKTDAGNTPRTVCPVRLIGVVDGDDIAHFKLAHSVFPSRKLADDFCSFTSPIRHAFNHGCRCSWLLLDDVVTNNDKALQRFKMGRGANHQGLSSQDATRFDEVIAFGFLLMVGVGGETIRYEKDSYARRGTMEMYAAIALPRRKLCVYVKPRQEPVNQHRPNDRSEGVTKPVRPFGCLVWIGDLEFTGLPM